jgi:hypothetical protein
VATTPLAPGTAVISHLGPSDVDRATTATASFIINAEGQYQMCYKLAGSSHTFAKVGGTFVVARAPGIVGFGPSQGATFVHEGSPIKLQFNTAIRLLAGGIVRLWAARAATWTNISIPNDQVGLLRP